MKISDSGSSMPTIRNLTVLMTLSATTLLPAICVEPGSEAAEKHSPPIGTSKKLSTSLEHNNRGVELGSKAMWSEAIQEHLKALDGEPDNTYFRRNLSSAYLQYGALLESKEEYQEAIKNFRRAIWADPNNATADKHLDNCLQKIGKAPNDYSKRYTIAEEARTANDWSSAIAEYRKCIKLKDTGLARYRLGACLYEQDKIIEAFEELRTAISKEWSGDERNELSDCHSLMGDVLWDVSVKDEEKNGNETIASKRLNNAAVCYKRAVTINPSNEHAVKGIEKVTKKFLQIENQKSK